MHPPNVADFIVLQQEILELNSVRGAKVVTSGPVIKVEVSSMYIDPERPFEYAPFAAGFTGIMRSMRDTERITGEYKESIRHQGRFTKFSNTFVLERSNDCMLKAVQGKVALPKLPAVLPNEDYFTDNHLDQVAEGGRILESMFGTDIPMTIGDCAMLSSRIRFFKHID